MVCNVTKARFQLGGNIATDRPDYSAFWRDGVLRGIDDMGVRYFCGIDTGWRVYRDFVAQQGKIVHFPIVSLDRVKISAQSMAVIYLYANILKENKYGW